MEFDNVSLVNMDLKSTAKTLTVGTWPHNDGKSWIRLGGSVSDIFMYLDQNQHITLVNTLLERLGLEQQVKKTTVVVETNTLEVV